MTQWKPVAGYEKSYEVSNDGQVRSVGRWTDFGRAIRYRPSVMIMQKEDKDGYYHVHLSKKSKKKRFSVHRLVATTFLDNPNNYPVVNHIDGNKKNNHVSNLEWCTHSHNVRHAFRMGLKEATCNGTNKPVAKLDKVTGRILDIYTSLTDAARHNDAAVSSISGAVHRNGSSAGFKWAFVSEGVTTIHTE